VSDCALDEHVARARASLEQRGIRSPDALFFLATGAGQLPGRLSPSARVPLSKIDGVPPAWRELVLHSGEIGGTRLWILEDAAGDPEEGCAAPIGEEPWVGGFPCWLAASAGASLCVHTSAGTALPADGALALAPGSIAFASDHVNLSGRTPLVGLGASKLGPLFPDLTRLHDTALRAEALAQANGLGLPCAEAVVACTIGPALETPAERAFWSRAGAQIAVQNLATPLHACAHAGLSVLCLIAVTDAAPGIADLRGMVAHAARLAPAIEDLLCALVPAIGRAAAEHG
jgi:purine-nucleoside phosphorylase